jgi:thymidylate synthase ThyX
MAFAASVVLKSVSEIGIGLTTMQLTYPLIVHNELLTHRKISVTDGLMLDFSRNASSNRARPSSVIIKEVLEDPYIPFEFRKRAVSMIAGEPLSEAAQAESRDQWLRARDEAVMRCQNLTDLGVHKQWANRLLGPFQWITIVATANDELWEHFFLLRDHPAAQPDISMVAGMANQEWRITTAQRVATGAYHLPYVRADEFHFVLPEQVQRSVVRCARTSYGDPMSASVRDELQLYYDLKNAEPPHASPFEHPAVALNIPMRCRNFIGWLPERAILGMS